MKRARNWTILFLAMLLVAGGCGTQSSGSSDLPTERNDGPGKSDSSIDAVFLVFEFDAELITSSSWNAKGQIENQLLYTIGQLNGESSISRLDKVELTNIETSSVTGGTRVSYHAKLIVAWGKRNSVPESYTLKLPKDVSYAGLERFTEAYSHSCVDYGAHDVDANSMWYYYRPNRSGCTLDAEKIVEAKATVTPSEITTTGKYPEYHKVWEDGVFRTVAIFGKYEDNATSNSDSGISAYNRFVSDMIAKLKPFNATTIPAEVPSQPGVNVPDVTVSATLPDGKKVEVVILLVDGVRTAGPTFDARYSAVSGKADFIAYNGHSGLGANIRALASKGRWERGQYSVVFMNGCDTYAYVDSAMADARAKINDDDPTGTKHLDMIMNAMPSFFAYMAPNTMAIFSALLAFDQPKTFEQIFKDINRSQVVLVSGEADNVYVPGYTGETETPTDWNGLDESGTVLAENETHYETPVLAAGSYLFQLTGDGDADLYVRLGDKPTVSLYTCRPYLYGSKESCRIDVTTPTKIYVMVRGWDPTSDFQLVGSKL